LARRARLRVCPQTVQEARVCAFAGRRVTVTAQRDGMATLVAELAETDAHRIHRRLTAIAVGVAADAAEQAAAGVGLPEPRTRDQLRADVLVDLILGDAGTLPQPSSHAAAGPPQHAGYPGPAETGGPASPAGPAGRVEPSGPVRASGPVGALGEEWAGCSRCAGVRRALRPEISVVVSLATVLGLRDDPAEVLGVGPVPAAVARELAADGRWRAWVTDAAGAVTATGSAGYVPSAAVARLVRAREPYCRFPGCRQPATRADLDHAIPWPRGATVPGNRGPLCRRHHGLKTRAGWELSPTIGPTSQANPPPTDPDPGAASPVAWQWRGPTGLRVTDSPQPPLA
jgi:hypothetical protein